MRTVGRPHVTVVLVIITIGMTFVSFHLYQKDKSQQHRLQMAPSRVEKTVQLVATNLNNQKPTDQGKILFVSSH